MVLKKFSCLLIMCCTWLMLLSGCSMRNETFDYAICGSYGVPGMFCADLKGGTYDIVLLDQDSEGRTLFLYTTRNLMTGHEETAAVVCQAIDSNYVYYYEDICYSYEISEEANIELLKSQNDWGLMLDYGKMSSRPNRITFDLCINTTDGLMVTVLKEQFCNDEHISPDQVIEWCLLDQNQAGQELYWVVINANGERAGYYVIADSDGVVALMQINEARIEPTSLRSFKVRSGWQYGCAKYIAIPPR